MFIKAAAWKYIFILHVSLQPFQNFRYVIKVYVLTYSFGVGTSSGWVDLGPE
jgi:hypothetical protein